MSRKLPQRKVADLVLDTNVFIQCRALEELSWRDVQPDVEEIRLLLTKTVVGELDKLKTDINRRRSDRARKAGQLIDRLLECTDNEIIIQETGPRIVLGIAERVRIDWENYPYLDREHADDRLIAEAIGLRKSGRELVLVSHDSGPRMAAKNEGLAAFKVPDTWLLPPESDQRDKEIQKLHSELRLLREQRPQVEVRFSAINNGCLNLDRIDLNPAFVPDFTKAELDALVLEAQTQFPMATFDQKISDPTDKKETLRQSLEISEISARWRSRSNALEIERYQKEKYPIFIKKVRSFFETLPHYLIYPSA